MNPFIEQIIDQIIIKKSFINNYPKPGVVFLNIDHLFNDPVCRKMVSDAMLAALSAQSFTSVAGIASRGYIFSGIIANRIASVGEQFIQKVKTKGDPHFVQIDTKTEYSSDALQVLKDTIQKGKKYLLTDDLIATGGSVLTAIQLIRQCGGIVDTVFAMTELLDFAAREQLKKEGVELISLLQFSNGDLQKLLLLQDCYSANPLAPLSYKLTQYAKGEQNSSALTVHLASQSLVKKEAAQLAFAGMFDPLTINLIEHDSKSAVSSQPFGYEETLRGAANRIASIADEHNICVAMENGIRYSEEDKSYYDFVHVIVKQGDKTYTHTQDCCKIPTELIQALLKNEDHKVQETWGEAAKRLGLAKDAKNPHQEACFGGVSRSQHLFNALAKVLAQLKENRVRKTQMNVLGFDLMPLLTVHQYLTQNSYSLLVKFHDVVQYIMQTVYKTLATIKEYINSSLEEQHYNISRLINFNHNKAKAKYAKQGILFATSLDSKPSHNIDLYNHGCPKDWNISTEKMKRNDFKIFSTGDAFSILSPEVNVNGADVTIHVGVEHPNYSSLVLLHEALQLCRCVYEHGAREITLALPEQFHPILHPSDFNFLLMSLFKASGVNKFYFYDKQYKGVLSDTESKDCLTINHSDLSDYLHTSSTSPSVDEQVMSFTRKSYVKKIWSKLDVNSVQFESLCKDLPSTIQIPSTKVQPHIVLCCSANKPLAEKIAASLRRQGELVRLYFIEGKGNEAVIPKEAELCGALVTIVQSTRPNPDKLAEIQEYQINGASSYFFEAAMIARQAHLRGAEQINLINPYQFSARSDKAENNPKGKTGAYVQQNGLLLEAAGVNQVITAECHDTHTMSGSYTGKNIKGSAVQALSVIATKIAKEWLDDAKHMHGQIRLVTPDAGATKRTKELTVQLQAILGKRLSESRILGEKQRSSHQDDSALINSLNSGEIGINAEDKYLITDDETATGNTLCQAITNLKDNGAKDIDVIVVHNNMPLDWLVRQLCLARFLYLGVSNLHFSDTQEMGTLAQSYEDLIKNYSLIARLPIHEVEEQVLSWFKKNIGEGFIDKSETYLNDEFAQFKLTLSQLSSRVRIHSLADEFAKQVKTVSCKANPIAVEANELVVSASATRVYASTPGSPLFFSAPQVRTPTARPNVLESSGLAI